MLLYIFYSPKLVVQTCSIYENKVKKENKSLQICYLTMRLHISQTTLLFNKYLVVNLSLRMTTASAMSLTPHSLMHSAAISEVFALKVFPADDTTTCFTELCWRERTECRPSALRRYLAAVIIVISVLLLTVLYLYSLLSCEFVSKYNR